MINPIFAFKKTFTKKEQLQKRKLLFSLRIIVKGGDDISGVKAL